MNYAWSPGNSEKKYSNPTEPKVDLGAGLVGEKVISDHGRLSPLQFAVCARVHA